METKKCPYCNEKIAADARKCRYCGEWIEEKIESPHTYSEASTQSKPSIGGPNAVDDCAGFFSACFVEPFIKWKSEYQTPRKSFWLSMLAYNIITMGLIGLTMLLSALIEGTGIILGLILLGAFMLYTIVPFYKLSARRLRDAGYSPWLNLLVLVPSLGTLALIVLWCMPSKFEHTHRSVKFGIADILITVLSVVLMVAGPVMLVANMAKSLDYDEYDIFEDPNDGIVLEEDEIVVDFSDSTAIPLYDLEGEPDLESSFDGKIGSHPVKMNLAIFGGDQIGGYYYYKSQDEDNLISLRGILEGGKARIAELDNNYNQCGIFELNVNQGHSGLVTFTGTYENYKSGRTFNVELSGY